METVKPIELPNKFKSWYSFWNELKRSGLTDQRIIYYAETNNMMGVSRFEYQVSDIKECLLNELLEHQGKVQEFTFREMLQIDHALAKQSQFIYPETAIGKKVKSNLDYLYNERGDA